MEAAGYLGAFIMGLLLGSIGGGGSILTVPILVYLFQMDPVMATACSLFIVGCTAAIGSVSHVLMRNVHWPTALLFGIPSIAAVYATRAWLLPSLPEVWISIGSLTITKARGILLLFSLLMLAAAWTMLRPPKLNEGAGTRHPVLAGMDGLVVGVLTGMVGAGGGFLIIPALVLLARLPMKQAVGSSLVIIAGKSLVGSLGDLQGGMDFDWGFLLLFLGIAVMGILAGARLARGLAGTQLKRGFAWTVLILGAWIIVKELWLA